MTRRKPPETSWETWIDRQIREAADRGEFDDLPGAGRPVPGLDGRHDELWWVKAKLRRENLSFVPPTLAIRKEVEDALDRVAAADSESEVGRIVAEINVRIVEVNAHATTGPPSTVAPLDVEREVRRWREQRRSTGAIDTDSSAP